MFVAAGAHADLCEHGGVEGQSGICKFDDDDVKSVLYMLLPALAYPESVLDMLVTTTPYRRHDGHPAAGMTTSSEGTRGGD